MASVGRAFVAVFPPAVVVDALDARRTTVRSGDRHLRWIPLDQVHLTLRFLGPVPEVDDLAARLRVAIAAVPPVEGVRLVGGGAFPRPRHGSVLWVGVEASVALWALAAVVESTCVDAGSAPEKRPFHAHLTVARASRARDLRPLVDAIGSDPVGDPWTATEVLLMASDTRPDGARYTEVARFPLGS